MQTNRQIATDERGEDLLHTLKQEVESRFNDIALNRMADVPVLNHEIRVEFCFCRAVPCALAGILITPWFMSVYCFPESETNNGRVGSTQVLALPSGNVECVVGHDDVLGPYWSCSLFSPMFEFSSHQDAHNVAGEIAGLLFDGEQDAEADDDELRFASLNAPAPAEVMPSSEDVRDHTGNPAEPLSRRDLFRRFVPKDEEPR